MSICPACACAVALIYPPPGDVHAPPPPRSSPAWALAAAAAPRDASSAHQLPPPSIRHFCRPFPPTHQPTPSPPETWPVLLKHAEPTATRPPLRPPAAAPSATRPRSLRRCPKKRGAPQHARRSASRQRSSPRPGRSIDRRVPILLAFFPSCSSVSSPCQISKNRTTFAFDSPDCRLTRRRCTPWIWD